MIKWLNAGNRRFALCRVCRGDPCAQKGNATSSVGRDLVRDRFELLFQIFDLAH